MSLGWEVFSSYLELGWETWTLVFQKGPSRERGDAYSDVVLGLETSAS